jgi:hypothetical protein
MSFLHISLMLGSLAALAPILFHMLGRRQPKTLEFPAIRFVRKTAVEAQRGWSVKRWILLALRVLMVLLLAAALAAPRVASGLFANSLSWGSLHCSVRSQRLFSGGEEAGLLPYPSRCFWLSDFGSQPGTTV